MTLPDNQDGLVSAVVAANARTIVTLETGGPVNMPWADRVPTILEAWFPGIRGGEAVARIVFGEVNPSEISDCQREESAAAHPHASGGVVCFMEQPVIGHTTRHTRQWERRSFLLVKARDSA